MIHSDLAKSQDGVYIFINLSFKRGKNGLEAMTSFVSKWRNYKVNNY